MAEPLTDEGIASLRDYCVSPRGDWNAFDALACLSAIVPSIPHLLDEVERARALLRRIEWNGDAGMFGPQCPACFGGTDDGGHAVGCELAALIGK